MWYRAFAYVAVREVKMLSRFGYGKLLDNFLVDSIQRFRDNHQRRRQRKVQSTIGVNAILATLD
jgi:Na+/H+ antiporter NhaB